MKAIYQDKQKGAVAPMVGILMVVFMLCVAVVVDLGHLHNVKVQLQRAADAAALGGAKHLDGGFNQDSNASSMARATAAVNKVAGKTGLVADGGWVDGTSVVVELGNWDPDRTITPVDARFSSAAGPNTANAIRVTATMTVEHYFFFFPSGSTISAKAIAVASPNVPVLPIALVNCIPGDESVEEPGLLPGTTVCDIRSYSFNKDKDDLAAWTSLTLATANQPNIEYFLDPETGREEFQKVVFGKGLPGTDGLENQGVDINRPSSFSTSYGGCTPNPTNYLDIACGLGRIAGKEIARPDEFPPPPMPPLRFNDPALEDYYIGDPSFDPLTTFAPLPRWYNITQDDEFTGADYFTRIWTQDGILLKGPNESWTDYNSRMAKLNTGDPADPTARPYGDTRFMPTNVGGGGFITPENDPSTPAEWAPDYVTIMMHAGYPKVYVNNGNIPNALNTFLANILKDPDTLACSDNDPFPSGEQTVRINMPVIFAGSCESFKALSNSPAHTLNYVGMARFLLTRAWKNPDQYDCGEQFVDCTGHGCDPFDPDVAADGTFSLGANPHLVSIEGINLIPIADDDEKFGSILDVYLVR
jgi:Flp pilus assembly protein TadG